ncbi:ABC transporter permease [Chryseolinea lacunae]|uniref:ABC transporter permease n=1 Tax=Chryseolinea lacunae TaxID=2801331 RepID=A0ABS1KNU4_9BACT|nr:ABC transporter permease [Chryseolinea lacunae]MBL0740362.1 ABC transporter permease [Chryseolinea lacunae]
MLRHNFLLIYRNFKRFKSTFFINLVGLSSGLACALMIYLWVNDEWQVNKGNANDTRLYQVLQNFVDSREIATGPGTQGILAKALADEMPEVEYAASVVPAEWFTEKGIMSYEANTLKAGGQFVSNDYFKLFPLPYVAGEKKDLFADKTSIAISEDLAMQLFQSPENALGKIVTWERDQFTQSFHISGVFKNLPANASSKFDMLLNYTLFFDTRTGLDLWTNSDPSTFVLLRDGVDPTAFQQKIAGFIQRKDKATKNTLVIQRYADRYLYGRFENGVPVGGRIEYVRLFSVIAIVILAIACINFMNLSTAKASRRVKEIGIKKAVGAARRTLVLQYLGESMFMTFLSLAVAILVVDILLPQFNIVTGKHLSLNLDTNLILTMAGITFVTGLLSGSYPALYLSGFKPATVLKGRLNSSVGEVWARKGLVVFQFAMSIILIVSVVVVYKQIDYVQSKNLGYDREHVVHFEIMVKNPGDPAFFDEGGRMERTVETFLTRVRKLPNVTSAANFYHDVVGAHGGMGGVDWEPGDEDSKKSFSNLEIGFDFIETLGIQIAEGRSYSRSLTGERKKIILNEAAIKMMGLKEPVGKTIKVWGEEREIIGVAKNFHFESLFEEMKPCLLQLETRPGNIMVKIKPGKEAETLSQLQALYQDQNPGLAFDYKFLDDDYQALYASEQRVSQLSRYFAALAILISCLGLFGLAAFTAERRQKEIGIRKILGSSEFGIVYLLSGDFTRIVLAAIVMAVPVSYFMTRNWLSDFAYKIDLEWYYFAGASVAALFIAWLTVGSQAIRAAKVNPTQCLKEQ